MEDISRRTFAGGAVFAGVVPGAVGTGGRVAAAAIFSDSDIRDILATRINDLTLGRGGIGIVAGVAAPGRQRIVSAGQNSPNDPRAPNGDTVFEIGSVGKVFTALLLADMTVRREVSLDDSVARYLPAGTRLPERNGRAIRIVDLATHMSGLPFMPDLPKSQGANAPPYSNADLYRFVAGFTLTRDPGSDWDYSNLGYWLLGEALAHRAGKPFMALLRERVLDPLRLHDSGFVLTPRMTTNLATGHEASLQPAPSMLNDSGYSLMPAAGVGFYSTANDLLEFVSYAMAYETSPLAAAFALTVATQRTIPNSTNVQALGWTLLGSEGNQLVFRDGGTFGFASCIAWRRDCRAGAVVLANSVGDVGDIGRHILAPGFPVIKPQVTFHKEIALDAAVLRRYAGRYLAPGEGIFTVALEGDHLTFAAPPDWGLPKLRIRPETQEKFFANELPLRVEFQSPGEMTVHPPRGQKEIIAIRK